MIIHSTNCHKKFSCYATIVITVLLQVKKDYLEGGAMADTADLVVLGAYYGTGNKGGRGWN